jgi:hypothetical protein
MLTVINYTALKIVAVIWNFAEMAAVPDNKEIRKEFLLP